MNRRPSGNLRLGILVACLISCGVVTDAGAQERLTDPAKIASRLLDLEQQSEAILAGLTPEQRVLVERALENLRAQAARTASNQAAEASVEKPVPATATTQAAPTSAPSEPEPRAGVDIAGTSERPSRLGPATAAASPSTTATGTASTTPPPPSAPAVQPRSNPASAPGNDAPTSAVERTQKPNLEELEPENSPQLEDDPSANTAEPLGAEANDPGSADVASSDTLGTAPTCAPLTGLDSNRDGVLSGADRLWRHVYLTVDGARQGAPLSLFELDIRSVALDLRSFGTKGDSEGFISRGESYRFQLIGKVARKTPSGLLTLDTDGLSRSGDVQLTDAAGDALEGFQILQPDQVFLWKDGTSTTLDCSNR